jgi:hypothetical protein
MKYHQTAILLLTILIFGCDSRQKQPAESIDLLNWTLKRPAVISENPKGWQWYRSDKFPLTDTEISIILARGEKAVQIHDVTKRDPIMPTTWFIHVTDPVPKPLSKYTILGDTLLFEDYRLDLTGKYFYTMFFDEKTSSFHEVIFCGKNTGHEEIEDFVNKTLFITDGWILYNRRELRVEPLQSDYKEKADYPEFPEGSLYGEWIAKIKNSPMPDIVGEAFETFLNIKPLPVVTGNICTFFWFEETEGKPVFVLSDRTGWAAGKHNQMTQIPGTHIHFLQTDLHAAARIEYIFRWNDLLFRDYLNPLYTGNGHFSHSLCLMPDYESVPAVEKAPLFYQTEYDEFRTANENKVVLILPPGYSFSSSRYRTLYLINSVSHETAIRTIMDNLMLSGQIPPMITVLSSGDDVTGLIRDVDKRYRTHPDASYRYLAGWSAQTEFIPFDSKISKNYYIISPLGLDKSFNTINDEMSVKLSRGLYDLPQVHELIEARTGNMKKGMLIKDTFPGGHHATDWFGEFVKLIIDN